MEIVALAALGLAWFYLPELIKGLFLDVGHRMAGRAISRQEDEQIVAQAEYYAGKQVPSDETVKKALEGRKRMEELRNKL